METDKIKQSTILQASSCSKYRDILMIIAKNPPKLLTVGNWNDKGDLTFKIKMTDIGLTYNDYRKYDEQFFSYFMVDFLGELIIRENLSIFADKLKEYDINDYMTAIEKDGIKTNKGNLIFKFNASLVKDILTEHLRDTLGES